MSISFTVSVEYLDGKYRLCPVGDYPDGFMDIGGFDTHVAAEAWLVQWAMKRRIRMSPIQPGEWRVSFGGSP